MSVKCEIKVRGGFEETLKVVLPLALMQLVYAANSIWDRFLLSQRGCAPLQASLSATMVSVMFVCLISATVGYTSVYVAQLHGAGKGRDAVRAFAQGVWLSIFSIPVLVALVFAAFALVDFAAHAPDVAAGEKAYMTRDDFWPSMVWFEHVGGCPGGVPVEHAPAPNSPAPCLAQAACAH